MFQLIKISPPQILRKHPDHLCGIPCKWHTADPSALRDGLAWVSVLDRPEHDPATQKLVPFPITDGIGYTVEDLTPDEIAARIPAPEPVTKLTLMRRLDDMGLWEQFKSLLTQLPPITQDAWALAQDIRKDDPILVQYGATIQSALGLTDEQFDSLLTP